MQEGIRDKRGNLIAKGDLIAYPVRNGSRMWLALGRVNKVNLFPVWIRVTKIDTGRLTTVERVDNVVVVKEGEECGGSKF